ncbi:uncharacterized protein LOC133722278 isoform X3 [Rosa rugosa]|uniref:uncharacterized protein LOC133722278 isoform X3 n=1 Tax=Rosa rugosa TaxID=74645 RepID=UPI002B409358|nr:uncharacterized protein LOC133722278 isoform X3 [Rosa rugosa]
MDFMTPRKLTFDQVELESNNQSSSIKKVGSGVKKKMCTAGFNLNLSALKNKKWKSKKNKMALVPNVSSTPIKGNRYSIASIKVWNKGKIMYGRIERIIS